MSTKSWFIILGIAVFITAAVTRYYFPQVKETIVTVDKEVIVTRTHEVKSADGTITTDTTSTETETKKTVDTKMASSDWFITAGLQYQLDYGVVYSLGVNKRLLGPVFVGVSGSTNKTIGVNIGVEF